MMEEIKEENIDEIVHSQDKQDVIFHVNDIIVRMKNEGVDEYLIMKFIQELELSLAFFQTNSTALELSNVAHARELLMAKILNGIDA
jgi:hypothetical protein